MKLKGQTSLIRFQLLIFLLFLDIIFSVVMSLRIRSGIRTGSSALIGYVAPKSVSCSFHVLSVMIGFASV